MTITQTNTDWPGRECKDSRVRLLCQRLVRNSYGYRKFKNHGMLYSPDGKTMHAVHWTIPVGNDFNLWVADLKRLGWLADLERETVRARRQAAPVQTFGQVESLWTDSEWRQRQADSDVWWRKLLAGADDPAIAVEAPPAALLSEYTRGLLERLDQADTVRPDAQGNGRYTLAHARRMLRDGYSLDNVIRKTGWGRMWLADLADRLATG